VRKKLSICIEQATDLVLSIVQLTPPLSGGRTLLQYNCIEHFTENN